MSWGGTTTRVGIKSTVRSQLLIVSAEGIKCTPALGVLPRRLADAERGEGQRSQKEREGAEPIKELVKNQSGVNINVCSKDRQRGHNKGAGQKPARHQCTNKPKLTRRGINVIP